MSLNGSPAAGARDQPTGRRRWDPRASARSGGPDLDERLLEEVRRRALGGAGPLTGADLADAVRASGLVVGSSSAAQVIRLLQEDLQGLGPLQAIADEPGTTDVLVDAEGRVWRDGEEGLCRTALHFTDPERIRALAVRLAASGGRRLDGAQPFADVVVGRYRIHAVLPPISTGGPLISVRIRPGRSAGLKALLPGGTSNPWHPVLLAVVRARLNFLVSGGTGSGKTTLLGALLGESEPTERLLIVEDARELEPDHPHVVGLQCRTGNIEGAGAVGMTELVRQALRMRPDRLVVGECRGAEVSDFLTAMNTGHDGAGGTVHASSAAAVPARLAALAALSGMTGTALAVQTGSALDLVIHMGRIGGRRTPLELGRLVPDGHGFLTVSPVLHPGTDQALRPGPSAPWLAGLLAERSIPCPW
ncbi:TadA family conjugal transfer-associated ATPase [Arthrobacter sp. 179]|uniref:TadA family conjugal transfer-associated ATPase n=1 Tax=Arthrobacter sp. 179 TaxID=3457734 RepID=UPI0040341CDB